MALRFLGITLAVATSSCIPSIKSVFVDLSYPDNPTQSAARDVTTSVDAAVTPTLLPFPPPDEMLILPCSSLPTSATPSI